MHIDTSILVALADIMNITHRIRINNKIFERIKFFQLQVGSGEFLWARVGAYTLMYEILFITK